MMWTHFYSRLVLTAAHCVPDDLKPAQKADFEKAGLNFTSFPNTYQPGRLDGRLCLKGQILVPDSSCNVTCIYCMHELFLAR